MDKTNNIYRFFFTFHTFGDLDIELIIVFHIIDQIEVRDLKTINKYQINGCLVVIL